MRGRLLVCGLASLALHGALLVIAARTGSPPEPEARRRPVFVQLLRTPATPPPPPPSLAPAPPAPRKVTAPVPRKDKAPMLRERPRREAAAAPLPTPTPVEPEEASPRETPGAALATAAPELPPAPASPDPERVFSEGEVARLATPETPLRPRYPERERRRGREASVVLRLEIGADGSLRRAEVVESGGTSFDRAALAALRGKRFHPALVDGRAVSSARTYRLRFALR